MGNVPPQTVQSNAKRGLELRKKYGRGGTEVGVARARDLSNGAALSLDTVKRMTSYFARHEVDKKGKGWGVDSAGYIAWLLWGGDAGWAWAKKIVRESESKEKSNMSDLTTAFFEIVKADKQSDGTLMVYGKATDDSLDIDQQICDPVWLDRAMPEWFKTGGNIREQHSSIAAGVAKEYEKKEDGHYIHALVVDPISVKKVDTGVLKGFSIGIKSPRVIRDTKAVNGRIIDGQIVEVSLVDRPANPNCQLILAKSVEGETGMWKTEKLIEKEEDFSQVNSGRAEGYEPSDAALYSRVKGEAKKKFKVYPSAYANAWLSREYKKRGGTYKKAKKNAGTDLSGLPFDNYLTREEIFMALKSIAVPEAILADVLKLSKEDFISARDALATLLASETANLQDPKNTETLQSLLESVASLQEYYESVEDSGEVSEEDQAVIEPDETAEEEAAETTKEDNEDMDMAAAPDATDGCDCDGCLACQKAGGCEDKMCCGHADVAKSAHKCLECGCDTPQDSHGRDDVSTAVIISPDGAVKSLEIVEELEDQELPIENSESSNLSDEIEAIVEKAIKSATESLKSEIAALSNAKEAAANKAVGLESELKIAKSLAASGGPKRTIKPVDHSTNDLLVKAATYKAKADASTDPDLMKGYKLLAEKYFAEADVISKSN